MSDPLKMMSLADLQALQAGDFSKVSTPGLRMLQGAATPPTKPQIEVPGIGEALLIGAGRTFDRIGKGMQQLYYGATQQEGKQAKLKEQADEEDRLYKPLQEARPFATGIGEALPSMVLPGGGAATFVGNAGRMALSAGVPAALEYGSTGERLQRGAVAAAAGAAVPLLGAVGKSVKTFAEPLYAGGRDAIVGRTLNRVAGDDAQNVIQRLSQAAPIVPGSFPTAAQVAQNGGIAAMERSAAAANPTSFAARGMEQGAARVGALRSIAGDDVMLEAARVARDQASKPLYAQAKTLSMANTPELSGVLESLPPNVLAKAQALARLAREPLKDGIDVPARTVPTGLLDMSGNAFTKDLPAQQAQYSGKALHYIKLALDDTINGVGEGALGRTEKALMTGAKDDFLGVVDAGIPAYGQARAKYAELSRPVNQMEIGQAFYDKLKPALSDYGALGQESKAVFGNAMRNGDKMAADATGFKGAKLSAVMGPPQMQTLEQISKDLARKANAENLGRGVGSDTFQKLAMQNIAEQSGMPRLVGGLLDFPGVARATKWVYRDTDEMAQKVIAEAMLDPKKAAGLMTAAKRGLLADTPVLKQLLSQSIVRSGGLLGSALLPNE